MLCDLRSRREETVKDAVRAVRVGNWGIFHEDFNTSAPCVVVCFVIRTWISPWESSKPTWRSKVWWAFTAADNVFNHHLLNAGGIYIDGGLVRATSDDWWSRWQGKIGQVFSEGRRGMRLNCIKRTSPSCRVRGFQRVRVWRGWDIFLVRWFWLWEWALLRWRLLMRLGRRGQCAVCRQSKMCQFFFQHLLQSVHTCQALHFIHSVSLGGVLKLKGQQGL